MDIESERERESACVYDRAREPGYNGESERVRERDRDMTGERDTQMVRVSVAKETRGQRK